MLVHRRITPSIKFASTHLYTWVERGTVRVKCLAQEHNTMSPARAPTRAAHSRVECTNHEATTPPTLLSSGCPNLPVILDTSIRKAHDTAWFALSFAFLCFTSCTHLPHWLNNGYQKFFIRNVRRSQLCTFLADKHWRR